MSHENATPRSDRQAAYDARRTMSLTPAYIEERSIPEPNSGCWLWLGPLQGAGYGMFRLKLAGAMNAHRASFIAHGGGPVDGLDVDHRCRNPVCVNPAHLEAVSHKENCQRRGAAQTLCKRGHVFDRVSTQGHRFCRECDRIRTASYRAKKRIQMECSQ